MNFSPDYNIIQEASISAIGLPAEFGGFAGAVLSAILKIRLEQVLGIGRGLAQRPGLEFAKSR